MGLFKCYIDIFEMIKHQIYDYIYSLHHEKCKYGSFLYEDRILDDVRTQG
jgi:hypothetical protein